MFVKVLIAIGCLPHKIGYLCSQLRCLDRLHDYNLAGHFIINIDHKEINDCREYSPVIAYMTGYCCYSVLKNNVCRTCREILV